MLLPQALHILCFGDSLTAGAFGGGYHPYAIALQASLEKALPHVKITIDNQGLNGDQVTSPPGGFLPRMNTLYQDVHSDEPYDYALILGGTNDLNQLRKGDDIYDAFQPVWDIPLEHGTKIVSFTVPECGCTEEVTTNRDILNSHIMNYSRQHDNFYVFDLHKAVPMYTMPEDERKEIWSDIVHFTAKGYDRVGTLLAERLLEILKADSGTAIEDESEKNSKSELKRDVIEPAKSRDEAVGKVRNRLGGVDHSPSYNAGLATGVFEPIAKNLFQWTESGASPCPCDTNKDS